MKRTTLLFAAMATLTLASCSKNEVNEGGQSIVNDPTKISFNSSTGSTRAVANGLTEVASGFTVRGLKPSDVVLITGEEATSTYLLNNGTWGWNDETGKDWPEKNTTNYPLTFYAEYPKVDLSQNAALNKTITMDLDMANQKDFLVAKKEVTERPGNGFSTLDFKHILSNLVFKIETRENYKVVIQSLRIVNTATSGRTFDYKTMAYEAAEPTYSAFATTDGTHKTTEGFFYTGASPFEFVGAAGATTGDVPAASGIMMQMPQLTIPYWTSVNGAGALAAFQKDALAWKDGNEADPEDKLTAWYGATTSAPNQPGMKDSEGWKGARIEVIYRIYDNTNNKSIVGRQTGETFINNGTSETAAKDYFVRVGYPLDLSAITGGNGWEMSKRYTYTIQLGTPGATNGILLEPGYKLNDGTSPTPEVGVDNPAVNPGNPITPGLINFTVGVDEWIDNNNGIEIL